MSILSEYWIIVSDEGPSTRPKKHFSFEEAYNESIRLSKLHPGLKFGVYKYDGHAETAKQTKKVTKWYNIYKKLPHRPFSTYSTSEKLYDSKAEAIEGSEMSPGLLSPYTVGTYSVEIEEPAEPKTLFVAAPQAQSFPTASGYKYMYPWHKYPSW